jgi:hypothetical protein
MRLSAVEQATKDGHKPYQGRFQAERLPNSQK